jgi:hypothetical protein
MFSSSTRPGIHDKTGNNSDNSLTTPRGASHWARGLRVFGKGRCKTKRTLAVERHLCPPDNKLPKSFPLSRCALGMQFANPTIPTQSFDALVLALAAPLPSMPPRPSLSMPPLSARRARGFGVIGSVFDAQHLSPHARKL